MTGRRAILFGVVASLFVVSAVVLLVLPLVAPRLWPRGKVLEFGLLDKEPFRQYAAYLTWHEYTGMDPVEAGWTRYAGGAMALDDSKAKPVCERAIYVWNGRDVGRGKAGFDAALDLMGQLPKGSAVKVFPNYGALPEEEPSAGGTHYRIAPFYYYYNAFEDMVFKRRLIAVFSPRDAQGHYCSEILDVCKKTRIALPE